MYSYCIIICKVNKNIIIMTLNQTTYFEEIFHPLKTPLFPEPATVFEVIVIR